MAGFKDPDVWAKAEEMLKDPQYMAAAKAKLAEIQAKAQANGLLDEYGQPIPGAAAASAGGMAGIMNAMKSMHGGDAAGTAGAQAREWELEAIERKEAASQGGEMFSRKETLDLIQAYYQLGERPRRRLLDLAKSLHAEGDAA